LNNPSESVIVPTVGGTFSPLRILLGLDEYGYSSSILEQMVTASARFGSFRDATCALQMSGIDISSRQVIRIAHPVAEELIEQRDPKVLHYLRRQLASRIEVIPEAVVVEVDGGRIRTRATQQGPEVHEAQNKEDKMAILVTRQSQRFATDPQSQPPESFQNPRRVQRLVHPMKGQAQEVSGPENTGRSRGAHEAFGRPPSHPTMVAQTVSPNLCSKSANESFVWSNASGRSGATEFLSSQTSSLCCRWDGIHLSDSTRLFSGLRTDRRFLACGGLSL
jgi:hypothetical protein